MFFIVRKKFSCIFKFVWYEKWTPRIFIVSRVKSINFKPQTAFFTPFRDPIPANSHLPILGFKPEKWEKTLKTFNKFLDWKDILYEESWVISISSV